MKATTKRKWRLTDGATDKHVIIDPGQYELERIRCPLGYDYDWLILKGTLIGAAEVWWRQFSDMRDEFQIIVED